MAVVVVVVVVVVELSSRARILGEGSTIHALASFFRVEISLRASPLLLRQGLVHSGPAS